MRNELPDKDRSKTPKESQITDHANNLDQAYVSLKRLKGIVKDPNLRDASTTIDEYVYGACMLVG